MRTRSLGGWIVASLVVCATPSYAQAVIDQEQPLIDASVGGLALGGYYHQDLAQVFTAGIAGSLVAADVAVACDGEGQVTLELRPVEGGAPSSTILTSVSVPAAGFPAYWPDDWPPCFRRIAFTNPVTVAPGSSYAIVLMASGSCGLFQGPDDATGDPYAGGSGFAVDDIGRPWGWQALGSPRPDMPFRTLVEPPAEKASVMHRGHWICIDANALRAHQAHGDSIWRPGCAR